MLHGLLRFLVIVIPSRQNAQELDMRNRGTEIIKVRKG